MLEFTIHNPCITKHNHLVPQILPTLDYRRGWSNTEDDYRLILRLRFRDAIKNLYFNIQPIV